MSSLLNPLPHLPTQLFSYSGKSKTFVCEASDLRDVDGQFPGYNRVWNDACDVGFTLVSERTGKLAVFVSDGEDRSRDGEVMGWRFKGVSPGHWDLKVLIIND